MYMRRDEPFKVSRVLVGRDPGEAVGVYAFTKDEIGTPTVGLGNHIDDLLQRMTPETADELAEKLQHAARVARGEVARPPHSERRSA